MVKRATAQLQRKYREDIGRMSLVHHVHRLLWYLTIGFKPVYEVPEAHMAAYMPDPEEDMRHRTVVRWEPLTRDDISRMTLQLKVCQTMLGKVLPDLKSVEIVDESEERKVLDDKELSRRIAGVLDLKGGQEEKPQWMN